MPMGKSFKIIVSACCLVVLTASLKAQSVREIYVATNGSATAAGTEDAPVNSIAKAIEVADAAPKTSVSKITIVVRGGTYYADKTLDLIEGKTWHSAVPLSIEAYKKEVVILHGGKLVPMDLIKPVADPAYLARFQPEVKNKIRQIDLKEIGIDPGRLRPVGFGRALAPSWMEVFLNGVPGQISRWPNKGTVPIDSVISGGSTDTAKKVSKVKPAEVKNAVVAIKPVETHKEITEVKPVDITKKNAVVTVVDTTKKGGVFYYNDPRPSKWKEPEKAWLTGFFMWGYADDAVPVKSIDPIRRIIKTALPTKYGFGTGKPWRAYYAYNIPEEVDVPGEYYVDSAKKILYFLPPDNLKTVELSVLEDPIINIDSTRNVQIKNIQFTCSRGMAIYMQKTTRTLIDGCKFTNLGMMAVLMGKGVGPDKPEKDAKVPVTPKPEPKNTMNIVNYIYDNTTFDAEAGTYNGVINCVVSQTGIGGIYMSGGNRLTLTPAHNYVKNCLIHDFNRIEKTYRPGIYIAGVGNTISNCEIYDSPSVAILLHGNNHVIEYNEIHNTTLEVDDMGAIYYGRDPSERGSVIRYNYFHNLGGQNKTMAIYHDDGACGMTVTGNVFYRAGTVAGFIGGGQDNNYVNNLFLNTRYAIHIDKRLNNWAKGVIQADGLFRKRMEAVNYLKPPYSTAYPTLKEYFEQGPAAPQRNRFFMNVMVNMEEPIEGDSTLIFVDKHNFQTDGDPGFKDYRKADFRLKANSIIYNELPGFIAPPLDKMGYRKQD